MDIASLGASLDKDVWVTAGIIIFLLILSGFFSGSETALTAASKARIHQLANRGDKRAKTVSSLIDDKERLIGGILLGNNLVNILASAIATNLFLKLFGEQGVVIATLVMTGLVLVFAEVLPKSYAIANPDRLSLRVGRIISIIVAVSSPIVKLVQTIVRLTLRLFGADISKMDHALSPQDDIRGTIDMHRAEGGLHKGDRDMLGSILDLNDVDVEEIMVHRKAMNIIDINLPVNTIINQVVQSPYTRIPLYDGSPDNIVGIIHAKDLLRAIRRAGNKMHRVNIKRIMHKPWFVPETSSLKEQLDAFLERKAHFALVIDEYGDLQGLVTLEDILEEIVGDIADEHDFDVAGVHLLDDGYTQVEGTVSIRDLNRFRDWDLPDDEATTVAGFVIYESETIPIVGQQFSFHGYEFEVIGRRRNQITQLKVMKKK